MRHSFWRRIVALATIAALVMAMGCTAKGPLPQPRKVVDPSASDKAVKTDNYDIAAVAYKYYDQGLNYQKAGMSPVFLVFKNKSQTPYVLPVKDMRGDGTEGEFLAYTPDEAIRLVLGSETFKQTASDAVSSGLLMAGLGAGVGALIGVLTGRGENVWKGAAIGGLIGGTVGTGTALYEAEKDLKKVVEREIVQYAWDDSAAPGMYTKVGYAYFPAKMGISTVTVAVRNGNQTSYHQMPVVDMEEIKK